MGNADFLEENCGNRGEAEDEGDSREVVVGDDKLIQEEPELDELIQCLALFCHTKQSRIVSPAPAPQLRPSPLTSLGG